MFSINDLDKFRGYSTNALHLLHEGVREALIEDDTFGKQGRWYAVRETRDWRWHADGLEQELAKRGEQIEPIALGDVRARLV